MTNEMNRRTFVKTSAAAAAGVATNLASKRASANDRLRAGFIGVANRGGQLLAPTLEQSDVDVVALCDVDEHIVNKAKQDAGGDVDTYTDFRRVIERDDIDVVFIATPDHWHAIQTIMACESGKDVFVEKPLAITIHEGRKMVEVVRRTNRVVQVGLQRRSAPHFHQMRELFKENRFGKVTVAQAFRLSNMYPDGIGHAQDSEPPAHVDWDLWLGPRAERPFRGNIHPYKFRWWKAYSSQIANWGVHYFDLIRWMLEEEAPASVTSHGGKFAIDDDRTIPDTMHTTFEFASGRLMLFGHYEASGHPMFPRGWEAEFRGTQGILYAGNGGFEALPERGGQFQDRDPRIEPIEVEAKNRDMDTMHIRNFLDCVKSRETPNCPIEEGHKSTIFAHLGNMALATQARLEWDPKAERVTNNDAANELLHYEYRAPWKL